MIMIAVGCRYWIWNCPGDVFSLFRNALRCGSLYIAFMSIIPLYKHHYFMIDVILYPGCLLECLRKKMRSYLSAVFNSINEIRSFWYRSSRVPFLTDDWWRKSLITLPVMYSVQDDNGGIPPPLYPLLSCKDQPPFNVDTPHMTVEIHPVCISTVIT